MSKIIINGKSDGGLKAYVNGNEVNGVMAGGGKAYTRMETGTEPAPAGPKYLCFEPAGDEYVTVSMSGVKYPNFTPTLYISSDGQNWTSWDRTSIAIYAGEKLYMYGENDTFCKQGFNTSYWRFNLSGGNCRVSGDITTLLTHDGTTTLSTSRTFYGLFENCNKLVSAPELPATTLTDFCYEYMFQRCTSLISAPELPATTLGIYCYDNMFNGCISLISSPDLNATTLAQGCYCEMFRGCSHMAQAPYLPATILVNGCYSYMFYGCSTLNQVKIGATTWNTSYASNWLTNTAASGVIYTPTGSDIANYSGTSGVPSGWTVVYY